MGKFSVRLTRVEEKERRRREAVERSARPMPRLACGHATSLDPELHAQRAGCTR